MAEPVYASITDLQNLGYTPETVNPVPNQSLNAILSSRSRWADGYIASQFTLPLISWSDDLTQAVVAAAAYDVMCRRGYKPGAGADINIRERFQDAQRWLERVASGAIVPRVVDSTPGAKVGVSSDGPQVVSGASRQWSSRGSSNRGDWGFRDS